MEWLSVGFGLLLGLALGILFARIYWRQTEVVPASVHGELQRSEAAALERVRSLESERARLDETVGATRQETVELERALSAVQARMPLLEERMAKLQSERDLLKDAAARAAALESEKKLLEQQLKAQREYLEEVKKQTRSEFENLANEVLKARTKDFNEQTEKSLDTILKPLKEKLQTFEKKVDDSYTN
ncbi:MAG TPA: hypothetical protein VM598_11465, partial [Bdellovibrionota bacterium]|nr:hypothetical protein [Bdellovibrionota bacterium]